MFNLFPSARPPDLRKWGYLKTRVALLMVTITFAVAVWSLYDARQAIHRDAEQQTGNITRALGQEIERTVTTLDLSLRAAIYGMNIPGIGSMPADTQQAILFDGAIASDGFRGIFILDESGNVIYRSKTATPPSENLADREYFRRHKQNSGDILVLSGPVRSRADGKLLEVLSRRITRPDGSFGGVAVAGIQIDYFDSIFSRLNLDAHGVVTLLNTDGRLITRRPAGKVDIGQDLREAQIYSHFMEAPAGNFEAVAKTDNVRRIFDYQQIADLPLIIAVGLSTADVYAGWLKRAETLGAALGVLSGLYLYLRYALRREIRQRLVAEQEAKKAQFVAEGLAIQLSDSLARREALINNTADAMIVARIDDTGEFLYEAVNPVWERLTDRRAAMVINRNPRDCLPGPVAETVLSGWEECVRTRAPVRFSFSLPLGDTEGQHWEAHVCPVFQDNGTIRRVIGVARDVTEQKRLEDKLRHAHRMEAVGELTAGIAHDFNNLLQAMLGALEIAEEQAGLDDDGRLSIAIANRAAKRGASLVHQLLAFSRKQRLNPTLVRPKRFGVQIIDAIQSALGAKYHLACDISDDAGPVLVDQDQLSQCLLNLALNARDATPQGGSMRLSICNAGSEEAIAAGVTGGDYTRFNLEDEGAGMPSDILDRAFEPFFTTKEIGKGTGLGLSMVQGFARQSGGEVTVESVVGVGTVVSLWLPRAHVAEHRAPLMEDAATAGKPVLRRVLVVDDEASVCQTLSMFLRRAGYEPILAETGEEALDLLQQGGPFDLLITDQSMPGMTGTALIEEAARLRPALPTMLMTGYDRVSGIERLEGRVTVLNKPFERAQFIRQVQALLGAAALCGFLAGENQRSSKPNLVSSFAATRHEVDQLEV